MSLCKADAVLTLGVGPHIVKMQGKANKKSSEKLTRGNDRDVDCFLSAGAEINFIIALVISVLRSTIEVQKLLKTQTNHFCVH